MRPMSETELEMRVAKLERLVSDLYRILNQVEPPITSHSLHLDENIRDALQKGNMIGAIKAYREKTNCGLAEAKAAVEEIVAKYGPFR